MKLNLELLKTKIVGSVVNRPSGSLAGHAAGGALDSLVYESIKIQLPDSTFRQFEYLNHLYLKNSNVVTLEERLRLAGSPTVMFLLNRGKDATIKWTIENQFGEKQNDTADILIVEKDFYHIVDVKTRNLSIKGMAPNIISAFKLASLCALMIDNEEFDNFDISYFQIDWVEDADKKKLVCKDLHTVSLFNSRPELLYINWSAAMQIQFHVNELSQEFRGLRREWAVLFLKHFVKSAKERSEKIIQQYVKPFEKYI